MRRAKRHSFRRQPGRRVAVVGSGIPRAVAVAVIPLVLIACTTGQRGVGRDSETRPNANVDLTAGGHVVALAGGRRLVAVSTVDGAVRASLVLPATSAPD